MRFRVESDTTRGLRRVWRREMATSNVTVAERVALRMQTDARRYTAHNYGMPVRVRASVARDAVAGVRVAS